MCHQVLFLVHWGHLGFWPPLSSWLWFSSLNLFWSWLRIRCLLSLPCHQWMCFSWSHRKLLYLGLVESFEYNALLMLVLIFSGYGTFYVSSTFPIILFRYCLLSICLQVLPSMLTFNKSYINFHLICKHFHSLSLIAARWNPPTITGKC